MTDDFDESESTVSCCHLGSAPIKMVGGIDNSQVRFITARSAYSADVLWSYPGGFLFFLIKSQNRPLISFVFILVFPYSWKGADLGFMVGGGGHFKWGSLRHHRELGDGPSFGQVFCEESRAKI